MADDGEDDVLLKLDLDDSGFNDTINTAKETLGSFGSGESVQGLVDQLTGIKGTFGELAGDGGSISAISAGFAEWGFLLGTAGAAVAGIASAFALTLEGENIGAINTEFDILAKNAGIAGDKMKEAFLGATGGMLNDADALKLANNAMTKLGATAQQLPELMELARKSSLLTGTDLETTFNNMTRAVQSGNARMFARIGISLDSKKAEDDYARSIGITADELSQQGKQQAIMNALLVKGGESLNGIDSSLKPVTTAWAQFKVAISELGEAFAQMISQTMGPAFQGWLSVMTDAAKKTKDFFTEHFGTGVDAAKLKLGTLEDKMRDFATSINKLQTDLEARKSGKQGFWGKVFGLSDSDVQASVDGMKKQYEVLRKERDTLMAQSQTADKKGGDSPEVKADMVNHAQQLKNTAAFLKELDNLKKTEVANDLKNAQTDAQLNAAESSQKLAMAKKLADDLAAVDTKYGKGTQRDLQMRAQIQKNYNAEIETFEQGSIARRQKMLDNYLAHAKGVYGGFSAAAHVASEKAQIDLKDTAALGKTAFNELSTGVGDAFTQMGVAAAGGSSQIEHAVLGSLGKIAANYGKTMMLASLFPFDPAVFAAGAALEVLGGILGQVGSGGSTSSSTSTSTAASTASAGSDRVAKSASADSSAPSVASASSASAQQAVTIQVQGSVFDSPQTGMRMVDLIRQASDQTGYNYVQIGNKPYGS